MRIKFTLWHYLIVGLIIAVLILGSTNIIRNDTSNANNTHVVIEGADVYFETELKKPPIPLPIPEPSSH